VPEGGYEGDYVKELAVELAAQPGDDPVELGRRGVALMVARAREVLEKFRVHHDRFQSELELHGSDLVDEALTELTRLGQTFDEDGATMLRTTAFGDDKDRALRRGDGTPTYFAADAGYLLHKYARGYDRLVTVLGADHYGYIARLKAAAQALGHDADSCEVVILQMVSLHEAGEAKKMSKRRGDFVTLDEFIDTVGVDASRWFLLNRSHDQTLDIDIGLATEQSNTNPVFYVQYAHARICSIVRKATADLDVDIAAVDASALAGRGSIDATPLDPAERRLVKRLAEFPQVVREAAERRHPHAIGFYAHALASDFTQFYRDCRVVGDGVTLDVTHRRLGLATATRGVLAKGLELLGVSAPEQM
jgi:arginyl-tRNA synthetase